MENKKQMIVEFKDGKTTSYSKDALCALFHLVRHFVEIFPNESHFPLKEVCDSLEDFETVINQYQNYYLADSLIKLTEN